jgi:hypothetical protein
VNGAHCLAFYQAAKQTGCRTFWTPTFLTRYIHFALTYLSLLTIHTTQMLIQDNWVMYTKCIYKRVLKGYYCLSACKKHKVSSDHFISKCSCSLHSLLSNEKPQSSTMCASINIELHLHMSLSDEWQSRAYINLLRWTKGGHKQQSNEVCWLWL